MEKPIFKKTPKTPVKPVENPVENSNKNSVQDSSKSDKNLEKITELTNDLKRTRADFENFRKQTETQKANAMNLARYATVEKFLPLLDDIDRAFQIYPDQLSPLKKSLEKTLLDLKLSKIDSTVNTEFNPDFHDAIMVEGDGDKEVIAETLRPGYLYDGAVIRPAMVKVKNI